MKEEDFNTKWNNKKIIEETIKSMNFHTEPSQDTKKRLELLEESQIKQTDKMDKIIETLSEIKVSIAEMPEKIFDKADDKYIGKKVGLAIISVLTLIGGTIIYLSNYYIDTKMDKK